MDSIEFSTIAICCIAALLAGFIDAIAGGGGLIQLPVLLINLPNTFLPSVIGTNKFPNFLGTGIAAFQYFKKFRVEWHKIIMPLIFIFLGALSGTYCLGFVDTMFFKYVLFFVLLLLAIFLMFNKNFGQNIKPKKLNDTAFYFAVFCCGFYDGIIGPGTGILLILLMIWAKGYDFMHASAYAKIINLSSNLASILLFVAHSNIIWALAIPMSCCNIVGAYTGSRMAILRGNNFIRYVFFIVIILLLVRFAWELFFKK